MTKRRSLSLGAVLLAVACGTPAAPVTSPTPAAPPSAPPATPARVRTPLPPIPATEGPLELSLVYPPPNALISVRDSNFVLGSVGTGGASLTINGEPVHTEANGAFLAWLPLPPRNAPAYELVATRMSDTARLTVPIRFPTPAAPLATYGALVVDTSTVLPAPDKPLLMRADERVRVAVRAPVNASAWLESSGVRTPLARSGESFSATLNASAIGDSARIIVGRDRDTVRLRIASVDVVSDAAPRYATLVSHLALSDTDRLVNVRPTPGDTYRWTLLSGTVLELTGLTASYARVRLDSSLEAWVAREDIDTTPVSAPNRVAENGRVRSAAGWEDFVLPMSSRPAFYVAERDHAIELTLYGVRGNTDIINYPTGDTLIRHVDWVQQNADRAVYTLQLSANPYGWLALWEGNAFVLRVRRPPVIDRSRPLAGRIITIDPGHPPGGATGPTGLYEAQAALWVAQRLQPMLEARGATVVMTRTTMDPVMLELRPVIARRANADAFVSIHFDALPDGMNPFAHEWGTGAYFYRDHSEPLARAVKTGMTDDAALPDAGVYFRSLAVVRPPWVPAILTENALIIVPQQEAALRDENFQQALARGIADGLEEYFRRLH